MEELANVSQEGIFDVVNAQLKSLRKIRNGAEGKRYHDSVVNERCCWDWLGLWRHRPLSEEKTLKTAIAYTI